jgi:hypothetical protein
MIATTMRDWGSSVRKYSTQCCTFDVNICNYTIDDYSILQSENMLVILIDLVQTHKRGGKHAIACIRSIIWGFRLSNLLLGRFGGLQMVKILLVPYDSYSTTRARGLPPLSLSFTTMHNCSACNYPNYLT